MKRYVRTVAPCSRSVAVFVVIRRVYEHEALRVRQARYLYAET